MTDEEKILLGRKWEFQNKLKTFGNVMGNVGLKVLDFRKEGALIIEDMKGGKAEFNYILVDRSLDVFFPVNPKNILRLRISELTSDKLIIAVSGKRGDELDDRFGRELMELYYAPMPDN